MRVLRRLALAAVAVVTGSVTAAVAVRRAIPEFGTPADDAFSLVAAMDGREFASECRSLRSGSAVAVFGGIDLDLTNAEIVDGANLTLCAVFGGIDVTVPPRWRVEVRKRPFAGDVRSAVDPDAVGADAPVLLIDGTAIFGGVAIHGSDTA